MTNYYSLELQQHSRLYHMYGCQQAQVPRLIEFAAKWSLYFLLQDDHRVALGQVVPSFSREAGLGMEAELAGQKSEDGHEEDAGS